MNFEGIQPPYVAFYGQAIRFHCEAAMLSIDFLHSFANMTNEKKGEYELTGELTDQILNHLHNIFLHAASISRYFWPAQKGEDKLHHKRASQLKSIFKIDGNSPLKSRKLRNCLEHFDENLDFYLNDKPIVGYVLPSYVGATIESDGVPTHLFRAFYMDTAIFEVLGEKFEVQPIVDAICELHSGVDVT
ncbi:hypothetical protein [Pseudoalteromonas sp. MB41]|jgi:hypothetical protein|uniref:hypothetical protein n=1 Tax=Pseudoalteromonas sp. MB41 TaxID=2896366 RepID=UPI001E410A49|nr:hypothetical protein [Pseudoalteromonas sp. MB41]MCC9660284.1 hypothetical protein [Pseudoalteromonas sp. MB41]